MPAWHSGSFFFQTDLILFIGDNQSRNFIDIAFGLEHLYRTALYHFVRTQEFVILYFHTCVVYLHIIDIQTLCDILKNLLLELITCARCWNTDFFLVIVDGAYGNFLSLIV
jgi:hypothetical protein